MRRFFGCLVGVLFLAMTSVSGAKAQSGPSSPDRQSGGQRWSTAGIVAMVPRFSETLGSIHAGAQMCDLRNEAQAVEKKHRDHVARLADEIPDINTDALLRVFDDTARTYRTSAGSGCSSDQRRELQRSIPDVFASIEAFHAELAAQR